MSTPDPTASPPTAPRRGATRWLQWGLLGLVGVVVLGYGLIFLYATVINDNPDELGDADLAAALDDSTATGSVTGAPEPSATAPETAPPEPTDSAAGGDPPAASGTTTWSVTEESELGYRVQENLFGVDTEGVGRTNQITGTLTIDGTAVTTADFEVDVASITSDESRRDNQFRGRIMSADEFPTATFVLTEPIELGTEPAEGVEVDTTATGELTLRGVTNSVTFDVTARLENGRIGVLGSIPVVFADYQIANPSISGITTEDDGLLEFVLVFEPA